MIGHQNIQRSAICNAIFASAGKRVCDRCAQLHAISAQSRLCTTRYAAAIPAPQRGVYGSIERQSLYCGRAGDLARLTPLSASSQDDSSANSDAGSSASKASAEDDGCEFDRSQKQARSTAGLSDSRNPGVLVETSSSTTPLPRKSDIGTEADYLTGPAASKTPEGDGSDSRMDHYLMKGEVSDASPDSNLAASVSELTSESSSATFPGAPDGTDSTVGDSVLAAAAGMAAGLRATDDQGASAADSDSRDEVATQSSDRPAVRSRRRKRPSFLDTMADVEASQNAMLASTSGDENDPKTSLQSLENAAAAAADAAGLVNNSRSGFASGSFDDVSASTVSSSLDWEDVSAQVKPARSAEYIREARSSTRMPGVFESTSIVQSWVSDWFGRVSYGYYCWRKDSTSDLLIILALNVMLLLVGATFKMVVINGEEASVATFWAATYNILDIVFGQDLPDPDAAFEAQAFGVVAASIGLASFALVLALVEQIVLEVIDKKVKTGSSVYESGHMLVLSWAYNSKDLEVVWKVLSQACLAYRSEGGRVVVVLSSRDKLEMEAMFRRTIPESARYGSTFVFRQGNPLVPDDLRAVAASSAAQVCVVSDTSRYPSEADAQSLRAAVLLDELDFPGVDVPDPRTGVVVIELKTANAVPLLRYSCSSRIIGLATAQLNARRVARILKSPVVGLLSNNVWSFNSPSQTYLEHLPQFVGRTFGSIALQLPDAIPYGITNPISGMCTINPPSGMFINEGDQIVMLRPTSFAKDGYSPASAPLVLPPQDWDYSSYVCSEFDVEAAEASQVVEPASATRSMFSAVASNNTGGPKRRPTSVEYLRPLEYTHTAGEPEKVLVCGWSEPSFMSNLLRELDHGPAALPRGSEVVMFNSLATLQQQDMLSDFPKLRNIKLLHIRGNPLNRKELDRKIDIESYQSAVVLCDMAWLDPDLRVANGIALADQNDMLRLDAMLMTVQLNLRKMLEDAACPGFNCIVEKCGFEGVTRFEDGFRLPLGIPVNFPSFAASTLLEVAFNPKVLLPFSHMGEDDELRVQDTSCLCDQGDAVSFWELQRRAQTVGRVLLGWLEVPPTLDQPLIIIINPIGDAIRSEARVWNNGDQHLKLVTFSEKDKSAGRLQSRFARLAVQETDGVRMQSVTQQPPLRYTSTLTEELLEAAAFSSSDRSPSEQKSQVGTIATSSRALKADALVAAGEGSLLDIDEVKRPFEDI